MEGRVWVRTLSMRSTCLARMHNYHERGAIFREVARAGLINHERFRWRACLVYAFDEARRGICYDSVQG